MSSHFATSQRGSTLIELGIAGAILGLTLVAGYQAVGGVGVAVRDGMDRSEVVPNGGFLLTQLAKAVRHADPDSVLIDPTDPSRMSFQEIVGADVTTLGSDPVRSAPITIRPVRLDDGRFAVERATSALEGSVSTITVSFTGNVQLVSVDDLSAYLDQGAKLGALGTDRVASTHSTLLGSGVAPTDADDSTLPGLHFATWAHSDGRRFVQISLSAVSPRGEAQRLTTTVSLRARASEASGRLLDVLDPDGVVEVIE